MNRARDKTQVRHLTPGRVPTRNAAAHRPFGPAEAAGLGSTLKHGHRPAVRGRERVAGDGGQRRDPGPGQGPPGAMVRNAACFATWRSM